MDHHQPGEKQRRSQTTEEALPKANWIVSQTITQPWSIITKDLIKLVVYRLWTAQYIAIKMLPTSNSFLFNFNHFATHLAWNRDMWDVEVKIVILDFIISTICNFSYFCCFSMTIPEWFFSKIHQILEPIFSPWNNDFCFGRILLRIGSKMRFKVVLISRWTC